MWQAQMPALAVVAETVFPPQMLTHGCRPFSEMAYG
jgi:hypothetical protein